MAAQAVADRARFRQVLAEMTAKAKARLPESNGRVEKAAALVLAGDVEEQDPDGAWRVGSCTDPLVTHRVSGTSCSCDDSQYGRAPKGLCKHVLATMLTIRVREVLDAEAPAQTPLEDPRGSLGEAPVSLNVKVLLGAHEVMVTLRGTDEAEVFTRLQTFLARTDVQPLPKPAPRKPYGGQQGKSNGQIRRDFRHT